MRNRAIKRLIDSNSSLRRIREEAAWHKKMRLKAEAEHAAAGRDLMNAFDKLNRIQVLLDQHIAPEAMIQHIRKIILQ